MFIEIKDPLECELTKNYRRGIFTINSEDFNDDDFLSISKALLPLDIYNCLTCERSRSYFWLNVHGKMPDVW